MKVTGSGIVFIAAKVEGTSGPQRTSAKFFPATREVSVRVGGRPRRDATNDELSAFKAAVLPECYARLSDVVDHGSPSNYKTALREAISQVEGLQ